VLAELIERISGSDYRDFIHERVTDALGLPRVVGIPPADQDGIAELSLCGDPAPPDELEAIFGAARRPRRRRPRRGRRGFGHTQSPRTFGHNGAGGQIAWADPESGLSFCYLTNGRDVNPIREGRRSIGISSRAAVCAS
jgi:CubicO group peptidase (beta-lactamase class C family)